MAIFSARAAFEEQLFVYRDCRSRCDRGAELNIDTTSLDRASIVADIVSDINAATENEGILL